MAEQRTRARGWLIALLVVAVVVGAVGVGVHFLYGSVKEKLIVDHCTFGDGYSVSSSQAAVASHMVSVVITRRLPERAATLVLAAGFQESKLRNLPAGQGDRDSVGVLQQRPSQGWGTAEQLSDVRYATGAFLTALVKVPNWQSDSLATVIQSVQISADGSAYSQHEAEAQALADALTGAVPAGLTCAFPSPTQVAAAGTVADQLAADLPVTSPSVAAQTVTVPGAGWPTAAWLVANADRLGIEQVDHADRTWTRTDGWQRADTAAGDAVVARLHQ